ncbi:MAG: hypothetical protein RL151_1733, partial [Bacteroidota bacterium]
MHRSIFVWILACVLQLTGGLIHAQERHIIELKDKRATALSLNRPQDFLSARSLDRRRRQGINIDSSDLPVCQVYIDSIQRIRNVVVLNSSKWLNQIAIQTGDAQALKRIRSFPFVKSVTQASFRSLSRTDDIDLTEETFTDAPTRIRESTTSVLNYGLNRS